MVGVHGTCHAVPGTGWHVPCTAGTSHVSCRAPFPAPPFPDPDMPPYPESDSRHRVLAELGRGTYGRILHVVDDDTGRAYALKRVRVEPSQDRRTAGLIEGRMRAEFEVGRLAAHRVLRRTFDLRTSTLDDGTIEHALLMEVIDAPPPTRVPFPPRETVQILRHLANAAVSLHRHGFVHAGLTPRALYLTTLGRPRLGGLADVARIGEVKPLRIGVPGFIAPEIALGTPASTRTVSFLFASVAYVMLVNRFPPAVRLLGAASNQITDAMIGPDAPLHELVEEAPRELSDFVRRALVANPAERPEMTELLDTLRWNDAEQRARTHAPDAPRAEAPLAITQRSSRNPRLPERRDEYEAHRVTLAGHAFGYRIGRWLGDGAWSRIYLVEQPSTGEAFAMKHVIAPPTRSRRAHDRLLEEWRTCGRLHHPSLRRLHALEHVGDDAQSSAILGLVMELLDATPLEERAMPRELLVPTLRSVAGALAYIHAQGLVHTNLKPRAIFLSELGRAKLAGTGQVVPEGTILERSRVVPGFVAREVVSGQPVTGASDVFAFAATAFHLTTGLFAPEAAAVETKGDPVPARLTGSDEPLDRSEPMLGAAFGRLAKRALRSKPTDRPSMAELLGALEAG
jgi:serine/threonine protein kinase